MMPRTCVNTTAAFAPYVYLLKSDDVSIQSFQLLNDFCQLIPASSRRVMQSSTVHQIQVSSAFGRSSVTQALQYMMFHKASIAQERQQWPYPRSMFHCTSRRHEPPFCSLPAVCSKR